MFENRELFRIAKDMQFTYRSGVWSQALCDLSSDVFVVWKSEGLFDEFEMDEDTLSRMSHLPETMFLDFYERLSSVKSRLINNAYSNAIKHKQPIERLNLLIDLGFSFVESYDVNYICNSEILPVALHYNSSEVPYVKWLLNATKNFIIGISVLMILRP